MTEGAVIAISATVAALVGPILMLWLTHLNNRKAKEQEYNRQDALSERIIAAQKEVAIIMEGHEIKLDKIHTLVNSNMTLSIQNELTAQKALHTLQVAWEKPSQTQLDEMAATASRIIELEKQVKERIKKDAQMAVESEGKA